MPYPPRSNKAAYERARANHPAMRGRASPATVAHTPTNFWPLIAMISATLNIALLLS